MSPKTPCAGCRNFHVRDDELTCDLDLLDWSIATAPKTVDGVQRWYPAFRIRFPIQCDGFAAEVKK